MIMIIIMIIVVVEAIEMVIVKVIVVVVVVLVVVVVVVVMVIVVVIVIVVSSRRRPRRGASTAPRSRCPQSSPAAPPTVGFHNFNLRIFNLRVSNPNKLIVDVVFDTMSDFNVPGSRPKKTR